MGRGLVAGISLCAITLLGTVTPSFAELRVCNRSRERASVSIGYLHPKHKWVSEGWWNVPIGECATVLPGDLTNRYVFFYAAGGARGVWSGPVKQLVGWFCIPRHGPLFQFTEQKYTLRNEEFERGQLLDCERPGTDLLSKKFRLVDAGDARSYTIELTNETRDQAR